MRKFLEEHTLEVLLILVTMLAITRWWIPAASGFELVYAASQWALSYDHGLIRRGLVGTIVKIWKPIVTIGDVQQTALFAYCAFLVLLVIVFYHLMKTRESNGRLFKLILLFLAAPATLSLVARDLGRFDLFLMMITSLCLILLSMRRQLWLIPILMTGAMFIHESFLILWAPTILAALLFVYIWDKREKGILITLVVSAVTIGGAFLVLYRFGTPTLGYEEFSRLVQSRAAFRLTDLSMHECYYGIKDHFTLTSPYLRDAGSIINFFGALLVLSPVILVLLNLWTHALRRCEAHRGTCVLFFLAPLSGLLIMLIATDFGRWLSAVIFCNYFAIFFLVSRDVLKAEELVEYSGGSFSLFIAGIILTYLFFGPLHDWNPYPYQHDVLSSSLAVASVLFFDVVFCMRWRSFSRHSSPKSNT